MSLYAALCDPVTTLFIVHAVCSSWRTLLDGAAVLRNVLYDTPTWAIAPDWAIAPSLWISLSDSEIVHL